MMTNRKLILALVLVFALCAAASAVLLLSGAKGTQVVVTVDGTVHSTYDLYQEQTVVIGPQDGSWHNTLEIRGGKARIVESDCDNQVCVHTPALQEDVFGIIVCLPHGLTVELSDQTA